MTDQEMLIREAIAAEAADAVDSRVVLAELHKKKRRKSLWPAIGVVGLTVAAAAAAVIIPTTIKRTTATPGLGQNGPQTVLVVRTEGSGQVLEALLGRFEVDGRVAAVRIPTWELQVAENNGLAKGLTMNRPDEVLRALEIVTGIRPDHWMSVTNAGLGRLATVVGGVDVCIKPIPGGVPPGMQTSLPPGRHTISGDQVAGYLDKQQQWSIPDPTPVVTNGRAFLTGLIAKINAGNLAAVVDEASRSVRTDEGWDVVGFAERFRNGVQFRTMTVPHPQDRELRSTDPMGRWDQAKVKARVSAFFAGGPVLYPPGTPGAPADECSY